MAYFYFDSTDVEMQQLLPSLLCQLSAGSDPCCDILSRLYSANDRGAQKPSDRAMIKCLEEMLSLETQHPTYIIMDALDECSNTSSITPPRDALLELLVELVNLRLLRLPNLRICVTSRLEFDIQAVLKYLTPHPVTLHDESGQQQDIANYVTSFVHSNESMRRWPEADKELVIKILLENADGMFSWAVCQLEVLQPTLPFSIRRILEALPESLDDTYERILREIREPNQGHARRLLHCLAAADRPLRVEEIAEVLAIDFNTEAIPKLNPDWRWEDPEEAVMFACSSLVIIVKDGDSRVVRFSHSSVKQFLTSNRLAEPIRDVSHYHIQLGMSHSILAQACLGILLQLDDRVDRDNIEGFPLARYAAQYWATHARVEDASSRIKDAVECLFDAHKPYFSTWLWIYNDDRGRSMSTIGPTKPEAVPLYYAARLGFQDLVEHLIAEHPEHVNAKGGREMTPMHAAASGGHANILRLLRGHGADVGSRNKYGETPLHGASWSGKLEAGQCLLDLGADVNARNEDDWTPLFHAVFHGYTEFARMLLKRGAVIDARSVFRSTALHAAVRGGEVQVVQLLLEHGADVNARDSRGWTPFRWKSTLRQEMSGLFPAAFVALVKSPAEPEPEPEAEEEAPPPLLPPPPPSVPTAPAISAVLELEPTLRQQPKAGNQKVELDSTIHVENTPPGPSPSIFARTATQERPSRPARRQVLRVDAQDGPWTVSVAENPHPPSSYTLYVKSECSFTNELSEVLFVCRDAPSCRVTFSFSSYVGWLSRKYRCPDFVLGAALSPTAQLGFDGKPS
ncbi:hypothetical protein F5888DRAFT_387239 [Russula emetica]|nr:hypothetical protein F5888DRAFT_387239 [Russula emetica]